MDNCTFIRASADIGSFVYLTDILNLTMSNCAFEEGFSPVSSGIHSRRIDIFIMTNTTVRESSSKGSGAFLNLEETKINIKNAEVNRLTTEKLGGFIFGTFGVNIEIINLSVKDIQCLSGGLLYLQQSENVILLNISVFGSKASSLSSSVHVNSYFNFTAIGFTVAFSETERRATFYLASINK